MHLLNLMKYCKEQKSTSMYFSEQSIRKPGTEHNSGYMVPLRFTQIFAPLRSAKTSYSRGTLHDIIFQQNAPWNSQYGIVNISTVLKHPKFI